MFNRPMAKHPFVKAAGVYVFLIGINVVSGQPVVTTQFHAVQSGGVPQCSTDPSSLALRARSRLDCSNRCVQLQGETCAGFNFRQNQTNCELFNSTALNYSEMPGCTLYQLVISTYGDAIGTTKNTSQTTNVTTEPTSQPTSVTTEPPFVTSSFTTTVTSQATCVTTQDLPLNCSFPFTYNGNLHYGCIVGITYDGLQNQPACLAHNWTWIVCPPWQENITVPNVTKSIAIPTLNATTPAMTVNGWIIFQQRIDTITVFNRNWTEYRDGFGSLYSNYWMGNEKVHLLTQAGTTYRLRIEMLFSNGWMSAEYDQFSLDNEAGLYRLHLGCYSNGECGDSLQYIKPGQALSWYHNGMAFSTIDRKNDLMPGNTSSCAYEYEGGWWYNNCYCALLNSDYAPDNGWWSAASPVVTQSRMMIKVSG